MPLSPIYRGSGRAAGSPTPRARTGVLPCSPSRASPPRTAAASMTSSFGAAPPVPPPPSLSVRVGREPALVTSKSASAITSVDAAAPHPRIDYVRRQPRSPPGGRRPPPRCLFLLSALFFLRLRPRSRSAIAPARRPRSRRCPSTRRLPTSSSSSAPRSPTRVVTSASSLVRRRATTD